MCEKLTDESSPTKHISSTGLHYRAELEL